MTPERAAVECQTMAKVCSAMVRDGRAKETTPWWQGRAATWSAMARMLMQIEENAA